MKLQLTCLIGLIGATFSFQSHAYAQSTKLDQYIRSITVDSLPGAVVLVSKKGVVQYAGAYGIADMSTMTPMSLQTKFQLASSSKQFTAFAIAQLEQAGKLNRRDKISKYFRNLPRNLRSIEIRDLIHHTSGLPDYYSHSDICFSRTDETNQSVLRFLYSIPRLHFSPGTGFEYSNTNYVLLALIVEQVSRLSFDSYMSKNIFEPLGMNETYTATSIVSRLGVVAQSYRTKAGTQIPFSKTSCDQIQGDGGVFSSAHDMKLWFDNFSKNLLLSNTTKRNKIFRAFHLKNGTKVNYGYGWFLTTQKNGRSLYHHGGGWLGYHHSVVYSPTDDIWVLVLTNHLDYGPPARVSIADTILTLAQTEL